VILDVRALARAWRKGRVRANPSAAAMEHGKRSARCRLGRWRCAAMTAENIARALGGRKICISWMARGRASAGADAFRPPDQMRSPRPAATGSRAKQKDHLNVVDNTRSEEQPQSEARWLAPVGALEAVDSHLTWSGRRDRHSEEPE